MEGVLMAENSGKPGQTSKPSKDAHVNKAQKKPEPTPNPSKGMTKKRKIFRKKRNKSIRFGEAKHTQQKTTDQENGY